MKNFLRITKDVFILRRKNALYYVCLKSFVRFSQCTCYKDRATGTIDLPPGGWVPGRRRCSIIPCSVWRYFLGGKWKFGPRAEFFFQTFQAEHRYFWSLWNCCKLSWNLMYFNFRSTEGILKFHRRSQGLNHWVEMNGATTWAFPGLLQPHLSQSLE